MNMGSFPPLEIHEIVWEGEVFSSSNVLEKSPAKLPVLEFLFVGRFLITASISFSKYNLSIQILWFLLMSVHENCMFLRICSFHPAGPICWHIAVHNVFSQSFVFLWCELFLFFHFWFYVLVFSLFFLKSLIKGFSVLFIFSKKRLLDSLIFF